MVASFDAAAQNRTPITPRLTGQAKATSFGRGQLLCASISPHISREESGATTVAPGHTPSFVRASNEYRANRQQTTRTPSQSQSLSAQLSSVHPDPLTFKISRVRRLIYNWYTPRPHLGWIKLLVDLFFKLFSVPHRSLSWQMFPRFTEPGFRPRVLKTAHL